MNVDIPTGRAGETVHVIVVPPDRIAVAFSFGPVTQGLDVDRQTFFDAVDALRETLSSEVLDEEIPSVSIKDGIKTSEDNPAIFTVEDA